MSQPRLGEPFELVRGAKGLFTTRAQGNLSLAAGVGHEQGLQQRYALCETLGLEWLCAGPQVHGTRVQRVREVEQQGGTPVSDPADGYATALCNLGVTVLVADCVPVLIASGEAVAAIHAGWRGLADGVLEEGVASVREVAVERATTPREAAERAVGETMPAAGSETIAVIGPCAGSCCYEVGGEVLDRFEAELTQPLHQGPDGKAKLDLRSLARGRLLRAGVDQVLDVEVCTICNERMFSHRREGETAGRQAAVAWLS